MKQKCAVLGCVTAVDRDDYEVVYKGTVNLVDDPENIPAFEALFAGIPVQSFSLANGNVKEISPFDDLLKLVKAKRPGLVVLENVCGLPLYNRGKTLGRIRDAFRAAGYCVMQEQDQATRRYFVRAVAA